MFKKGDTLQHNEKWNKVVRSPEYREKMRIISKKNGNKPPVAWGNKTNIGRKHTEEWKNKAKERMKGNKYCLGKNLGVFHHNWKGGTSKLRANLLGTFEYRQWRNDVFTRDNFTCQDCGERGGDLEAHHIKLVSLILKENNIKTLWEAKKCQELLNTNNGITLCRKCHEKTF